MKIEAAFKDQITKRIWDQYLRQVERVLKPLDPSMREETLLELQAHLLDGFRDGTGETEAERLLNAIDRLGEPEEILKPMMADKLLTKGIRTLHPGSIAKGLFYSFFGRLRRIALALAIGIGFVGSLCLAAMGILKFIFPRHIGFLLLEGGGFIFGMTLDASHIKTDVLGYWFVPIALVLAFLFYLLFSQLLRLLKKT